MNIRVAQYHGPPIFDCFSIKGDASIPPVYTKALEPKAEYATYFNDNFHANRQAFGQNGINEIYIGYSNSITGMLNTQVIAHQDRILKLEAELRARKPPSDDNNNNNPRDPDRSSGTILIRNAPPVIINTSTPEKTRVVKKYVILRTVDEIVKHYETRKAPLPIQKAKDSLLPIRKEILNNTKIPWRAKAKANNSMPTRDTPESWNLQFRDYGVVSFPHAKTSSRKFYKYLNYTLGFHFPKHLFKGKVIFFFKIYCSLRDRGIIDRPLLNNLKDYCYYLCRFDRHVDPPFDRSLLLLVRGIPRYIKLNLPAGPAGQLG